MRRLPHLLMILSVSVFIAAEDANTAPKSDSDEIHGLWMFTDTWIDGKHKKHPTTHEDGIKIPTGVRISKDRIQFVLFFVGLGLVTPEDTDAYKFTMVMDTTKTPKQLDVVFKVKKNGKQEGIPFEALGVYSLDKDELVLCFYGMQDEPKKSETRRPKSVPKQGKKGDGLTIWVFKRVRLEDKKP